MSDRRYRMDAEDKPEAASPLAELVDTTVRRISTSLVIAGGLIALGLWGGGNTTRIEAPNYGITTSPDGQAVYRINTETGSIVACRADQCWLMQRGSEDLEDEPPTPPPAPQLPAPSTAPAQPPATAPATAPAPAPAPANR
jgi:hypothetical protein